MCKNAEIRSVIDLAINMVKLGLEWTYTKNTEIRSEIDSAHNIVKVRLERIHAKMRKSVPRYILHIIW